MRRTNKTAFQSADSADTRRLTGVSSAQFVALAVEESHGILDQPRDFRPSQMTLAATFVEIGFQLRPALLVILKLQEMFPFGAKCFGKRIGQTERDELRESWFIAMRQVAAFIPTAKTLLEVFQLWWRGPATLAFDQIPHAGIVRWSGTTRFGRLAHAEH